jgi:hypothetical protein
MNWAKQQTMYELKKECEQLHTLSCPLLEHKVFAAPKVESMYLLHKEEMKAMRICWTNFFFPCLHFPFKMTIVHLNLM